VKAVTHVDSRVCFAGSQLFIAQLDEKSFGFTAAIAGAILPTPLPVRKL
jgi:hypothetical protein